MPLPTHPSAEAELTDLARFLFNKGKSIHQRIDRIIRDTMFRKDVSMKSLTIAQAEMIMMIHQAGTVSITELSKLLNMSIPSASTMVDRLVEKKLLSRTRDNGDRRKVLIRVSSDTELKINRIEQAVVQTFVNLISIMGTEIGSLWCKVLVNVEAALDNHPEIANFHIQNDGDKNGRS